MNLSEAIKILREHNLWRRGNGPYEELRQQPFNPKELGEALDIAVHLLEQMEAKQ